MSRRGEDSNSTKDLLLPFSLDSARDEDPLVPHGPHSLVNGKLAFPAHQSRPNVEPATLHTRGSTESEPLLTEGGEPTDVGEKGEEEEEEEEEGGLCVQFVTSDCPSVVSSNVISNNVGKGTTAQNDIISDVKTPQCDETSSDTKARQHDRARADGYQKSDEINDVKHIKGPQKSTPPTNCLTNTPPNNDRPPTKDNGPTNPTPQGDKSLRDDFTFSRRGDVDKNDVSKAVTDKRPGSPGSVARSFTTDCLQGLEAERRTARAGDEDGGGGDGGGGGDCDPSKAVRRLSSGDVPYWFYPSQDGSSDVHDMTLVVPFPTRRDENYLIGRASPRADTTLVRRTRFTEVAPTNSSLVDDEDQWKMPLHLFTSKKQGTDIGQYKSKRIRSYYKAQDEMITAFEEISLRVNDDLLDTDVIKRQRKLATFFSKVTLAVNVALLIGKLVASILSGSISIISSLVDSVVDLLSGLIMWWATRAVKKRDPYTYPQGRTKLEPVAIIILSVVMALASLQLIRESVEKVVTLASDPTDLPRVDAPTFAIAGSTVVVKLVLWLVCRRVKSSIVRALAMDHRNDVLSNTVAIICGYLGSREFQKVVDMQGFIYVDPAGAIIISLYIVVNWWQTGSEQIEMLTGHTARPDFLSKLTWTAMNHDPNVRHIDTVRAFHFGNNFLVEMDIVLPEDMSLRVAHDIGESLQQKLENIPEVERAFVHLDYEFSHNPNSEHKVV